MSAHISNVRPKPDAVLVDIADYVAKYKITSKDASGATANGVAVTASSIKKTDALAAASLPLRVATTRDYSTTQNGVTVAVTTVEFAPDETRAFVTVINDSQADASFSATSAHAVQNSQSFDTKPNLDYPQVASDGVQFTPFSFDIAATG